VIPGDTKKEQQPTIIKVNQDGNSAANKPRHSRANSSSSRSSSNNNNNRQQQQQQQQQHQSLPHSASNTPTMSHQPRGNGEWIQNQETQQRSSDFDRNASARSSRRSAAAAAGGSDSLPPPPRPYKSPELTPYANLDQRAFMNNPRNQVLPSPGGSLPSNRTPANPTTSYATVMSNSKVVEYNEKRVNGELVSQSVHKQERVNQV